MLNLLRPFNVRRVMLLALLACACGSDDKKVAAPPVEEENDGGAPPVAPSYPPALGPEDCVTTTSKITLTQPEGAAVWGGIVLLEFEVEGAKVDSFDTQLFDPALGAWTNYYVSVSAQGQREDGSYFMVVTPYLSEANKDGELKLRVRPSQQGCPDADWTETSTFTAGDPLVGTKWKAHLSAGDFNGELTIQRTPTAIDGLVSSSRLTVGDATLSLEFGKKGVFTEVLTVDLAGKKDEPYDGCTLNLTFSGTYEVGVRQRYNGIRLAVSQRSVTSVKGTTCDFPTTEEMALSSEDFEQRLSAYTQQGISIDYLPLLYQEPGTPVLQDSNFSQVFQELPQFLGYQTTEEGGNVSGYVNVQELSFERQ